MCGIAGIISTSETPEEVELPLLPMQAALRHRGPDDQGEWISPSRCAALAHTSFNPRLNTSRPSADVHPGRALHDCFQRRNLQLPRVEEMMSLPAMGHGSDPTRIRSDFELMRTKESVV
jgi:hypothetical protein